jgi:hypothetical protein
MNWKDYSGLTKIISIILLAFIVIFLIFWAYTKVTSQTIQCNKITVGVQKSLNPGGSTPLTRDDIDFCLYHEGWDKKSEKICSLIDGRSRKDDCYWVVSTSSKNKNICESIQDNSKKDSCFYDVAKLEEDVAICDSALGLRLNSGSKQDCLLDIAYASKNSDICLKIENQDIKETCFLNVAEKSKNIKICELISDSNLKESCINLAK